MKERLRAWSFVWIWKKNTDQEIHRRTKCGIMKCRSQKMNVASKVSGSQPDSDTSLHGNESVMIFIVEQRIL